MELKQIEMEFKRSRAMRAINSSSFNQGVSWSIFTEFEDAQRQFKHNHIVFTCIHSIATSAASVPFKVKDIKTDETVINDLSKLLAKPNNRQDAIDFFTGMYAFYKLNGNCFTEASRTSGVIDELYVIPPQHVSIHKGTYGVAKYTVSQNGFGRSASFPVGSVTGACDLLHWKTFNPEDMNVGMSPIQALYKVLSINDSSLTWNKALLDNGARPSGYFYYDDNEGGGLDEDSFNRLKKEIKDNYQGSQNAGVPLLLEGGMKWEQMSLSPMDMDYMNSRNLTSKDIAIALEYPPALLGLSGDNTYNNQKEARLALWTDSIVPLVDNLASHLNRWLLPMFDMSDRFVIVPDYDQVGALQSIRDAIWEKAATKGKDFLTINERRKLVGYKKIAGMDGVLSNASQVPLTYALEHPATRAPFVQTDSNVQINGRSRQSGINVPEK